MAQTQFKTDKEIHEAVLQELKWSTKIEETEVGVEVDEGVVTLTGTVSCYAKKVAAQEAAHQVAGVLDVANDIKVQVPGSMSRTDTEIALAVRRALEWDALIAHDKILTTVSGGWVTLEGQVPFYIDSLYAERAIHNLTGVRGVTNNLTVVSEKVSPDSVQHAIEQALERRAEREARRILVEVTDGKVALTGQVQNWNEKQAVLGAAGSAPGVVGVVDHLKIARRA